MLTERVFCSRCVWHLSLRSVSVSPVKLCVCGDVVATGGWCGI